MKSFWKPKRKVWFQKNSDENIGKKIGMTAKQMREENWEKAMRGELKVKDLDREQIQDAHEDIEERGEKI